MRRNRVRHEERPVDVGIDQPRHTSGSTFQNFGLLRAHQCRQVDTRRCSPTRRPLRSARWCARPRSRTSAADVMSAVIVVQALLGTGGLRRGARRLVHERLRVRPTAATRHAGARGVRSVYRPAQPGRAARDDRDSLMRGASMRGRSRQRIVEPWGGIKHGGHGSAGALRAGRLSSSPIRVLAPEQAAAYATAYERHERAGRDPETTARAWKIHCVFRWAYEIATNPAVLDVVEQLVGPNILVFGSRPWNKLPHDERYVALAPGQFVLRFSTRTTKSRCWVALTDSTVANGCMRYAPGSHRWGDQVHTIVGNPRNRLDPRSGDHDDRRRHRRRRHPRRRRSGLHHRAHRSRLQRESDRDTAARLRGERYIPTHVRSTIWSGAARCSCAGSDTYPGIGIAIRSRGSTSIRSGSRRTSTRPRCTTRIGPRSPRGRAPAAEPRS